MIRYIDAESLENAYKYVYCRTCTRTPQPVICSSCWVDDALDVIDDSPTEDVAPVIHAHWETDKHAALDFCSSCGEAVERYVTAEQMDKSNYKGATYWNYCPHCGAKMDGRDNDRWQRPEELGVKECPVCGEEGNDE